MNDLKKRAIRGGLARILAQIVSFLLRIGSLVVLARLLSPRDFGLVSMVTAFTGLLTWFRDFGLSAAAIQRSIITEEQISTLFWINILIGALLWVIVVSAAPFVAAFYHEPQLFGVTTALAVGFLFNSAGVQHSAILHRNLNFSALAAIDIISLGVASAIAIGGAEVGYGYWALVAMTLTSSLIATIGFWLATGWIPGRPRGSAGIRSMVNFGGAITMNGLIAYIAYNAEKLMLGRYWGADAIGIYGRAYQLVNIPTDNLNSAVGAVAFSALSRVQNDPTRFKSYFLKGFSLVLGFTLPITIACALFADDLVYVLLGDKWKDTVLILRLLAPTIGIFAVINPLGWLLYSIGLVARSLRIALVFAPIMIVGCVMGLPYGAQGVAFAYSGVMTLWVVPHILWCVHGTPISFWDILLAVSRPLACVVAAGALAFAVRNLCSQLTPLLRLFLESGVLMIAFFGALLLVAGQRSLYVDLIRGLRPFSAGKNLSVSG